MSTLSELYLGSEPVNVTVQAENLVIGLENGQSVSIPLSVVGQFASGQPSNHDTQILILTQPPKIDHVHVSESALSVYLTDGRIVSSPLSWFPRLVHGTSAERNDYELVGEDDAIHWTQLDEDIDLERLLKGGKSTETESSIQRWLASRHEKIVAQ